MQCDMCGKQGETINAIVEGTMLSVCNTCSKFGNVLEVRKPEIKEEISRKVPIKQVETIESVIDDYFSIIKKAREKKELKQEDVAKQIAEKESVIQKVESGSLKPSLKLAKKFEQFFNIKLIEIYTEERKRSLDFKSSNLTIGDLLRMKK